MAAFAPARWLAAWVQNASGGQVNLVDAQGTLWQGSSRLVLAGGAGSQGSVAMPGRLDWQLRPALGGLRLQAQALCCMVQPLEMTARLRWGGWGFAVAAHQSNWPASLLAGLGTPWNTIAAEGNLAVSNQGLSLEWSEGRMALSGTLQIDAQDMASRLTTLKPMGSYRLLLTGGPLVSVNLQTLKGSLQLSGAGQWVGGRLRFDGVASAAPDRQDALSNLLNIIGRRDGARSIMKVG
jgi:general secretion pathway protein N